LYRALEAACAAYASLNLSLLHYILYRFWDMRRYWSSIGNFSYLTCI